MAPFPAIQYFPPDGLVLDLDQEQTTDEIDTAAVPLALAYADHKTMFVHTVNVGAVFNYSGAALPADPSKYCVLVQSPGGDSIIGQIAIPQRATAGRETINVTLVIDIALSSDINLVATWIDGVPADLATARFDTITTTAGVDV